MTLNAAIIGSGPSGFYTADSLIKSGEDVEIDIIDRLPTPFGLIRGGVAPDHQTTKKVAKAYEKTALNESVNYFGNVEVGKDISIDELRKSYDAVVLAVGAPTDRKLGIPGDDKKGVYGSADFVGWYNGHPDYTDYQFDFNFRRILVDMHPLTFDFLIGPGFRSTRDSLNENREFIDAVSEEKRYWLFDGINLGFGVGYRWGNHSIYGMPRINHKDAFNEKHHHGNSALSAAYYVKAEDNAGDIVFFDPRQANVFYHPSSKKANNINAQVQSVTPKPGTLVLFPSYLEHKVDPNLSSEERIVISFNISMIKKQI